MKSILLARVSTREQAESYSLPAQVKSIEAYGTQKSFIIVKRFIIPETASRDQERKKFKEMLSYLEKHKEIKAILCEKVDRMTRNFKDAVKLDEWLNEDLERQIHFVKQSLIIHKNAKSHEKFQWDIYVTLARQYSNNLSEETKKGLFEKAEEGWYPGNSKKGYKTIGDIGKKTWIIDNSPNSEAPFIRKAFELYVNNNWSLKKLREEMFQEGWKQKNGKPIAKSTLAFILKDVFYCKKFNWRGKIYNGNHECLIPDEIFEIVQRKLQEKSHPKYSSHNHLFKGMIKCGQCGCAITAEIQKKHTYYHCTHFKPCNQRKFIREEEIEKQILSCFDEIAIKDKKTLELTIESLRGSHAEEMSYHNQALTALNKRYQTLQERLDELYIDKLDRRITLEKFESLGAKFREEQREARQEIVRHENANINYFELGANLLELSSKAEEIYLKREPIEDKWRLLNLIFLNLTLKDGFISKTYQKPFQIISERVKNGNWLGD